MLCQPLNFRNILQAVRQIPLNVKRQSRACSRQGVNLRGVAEFLFDVCCGGRLNELSEASARIGKTPGGQLDMEFVEGFPYDFNRRVFHCEPSVRVVGLTVDTRHEMA